MKKGKNVLEIGTLTSKQKCSLIKTLDVYYNLLILILKFNFYVIINLDFVN